MEPAANREALVAIDLGAQSCRVSLLRRIQGIPNIHLIHRFPNAPVQTNLGLCWNIEKILEEVSTGLKLCAEAAPEGIATIGVDGWAVDYVRLAPGGGHRAPPFCYRDVRTEKAESLVHQIVSPDQLYASTGIQILRLNTIYQLYADKLSGRDANAPWLNLPEYLTHRLGGVRAAEYTNATHTGLVALASHQWCDKLFQELGLDTAAAPEIVPTGSPAGALHSAFRAHPAFRKTQLIFPACHDTASAIAAIPAIGEDWAFISSGTWSLVGTLLQSPCISEESRQLNFTNLGGVGNQICFLKNVNGMWLLRECMAEWERRGRHWTIKQLLKHCDALPTPDALIDVDSPDLMLPGNINHKINAQLERAGRRPFAIDDADIPRMANTIFHSLAARYADVLSSVASLTKKRLQRLFIVGGGSKNTYLNRLTAERTGLQVIRGSTEGATIGNFAIQLAALQGDWNPSTRVSAAVVAKWAEKLLPCSLAFSGESNSHRGVHYE